jgi:hypothetical protein
MFELWIANSFVKLKYMKYKQHFPTPFTDWEKARVNSEHNYDVLKGIDKEQRDRGLLLWRYFRRNVADGYAYYQIVRVTKKSAIVEVCRGICLDEWTDNMLGESCELPIKIVEDLIKQKDALEKLFGGE